MKRKVFAAILWIIALGWTGFCLFLSWQTGEDTGALSMRLAQFLLRLLARVGVELDLAAFHMQLRLAAHFGVFFVAGLLFAAALAASLPAGKRGPRGLFFIPAALCAAGAVLAETVKLKIPGRHLQWDEAMLNAAGAALGVFFVWTVRALFRLIQGALRRRGQRGSPQPGRHLKEED